MDNSDKFKQKVARQFIIDGKMLIVVEQIVMII
jgi:hypothetical protein